MSRVLNRANHAAEQWLCACFMSPREWRGGYGDPATKSSLSLAQAKYWILSWQSYFHDPIFYQNPRMPSPLDRTRNPTNVGFAYKRPHGLYTVVPNMNHVDADPQLEMDRCIADQRILILRNTLNGFFFKPSATVTGTATARIPIPPKIANLKPLAMAGKL